MEGKAGWGERKAGKWGFWHRWWLVLEAATPTDPSSVGQLTWFTVEDTESLSAAQYQWSRDRSLQLEDVTGLRLCSDPHSRDETEIELLTPSATSGVHRLRFANVEERQQWVRKLSELIFSRECRAGGADRAVPRRCPQCTSAVRAPGEEGWIPDIGTECLWQPHSNKKNPHKRVGGPLLARVVYRGWPAFAKPCKEKGHRQQWLGLVLHHPVSRGGNGTVKGVQYFTAPSGCGRMAATASARCCPVPVGYMPPELELEPELDLGLELDLGAEPEPVPEPAPALAPEPHPTPARRAETRRHSREAEGGAHSKPKGARKDAHPRLDEGTPPRTARVPRQQKTANGEREASRLDRLARSKHDPVVRRSGQQPRAREATRKPRRKVPEGESGHGDVEPELDLGLELDLGAEPEPTPEPEPVPEPARQQKTANGERGTSRLDRLARSKHDLVVRRSGQQPREATRKPRRKVPEGESGHGDSARTRRSARRGGDSRATRGVQSRGRGRGPSRGAGRGQSGV